MPVVKVSITPSSAARWSEALREAVKRAAPADVDQSESPDELAVNVDTLAECDRNAGAIVDWINSTSGNFWLLTSGPAGNAELRMLREDYTREFIKGNLDICASEVGLPA